MRVNGLPASARWPHATCAQCDGSRLHVAGRRNGAHCTVLSKNYSDFFLLSSGDAAAAERNCLFIAGNEEGGREGGERVESSHRQRRAEPRSDTLNSATAMRGSIEEERERTIVRPPLALPSSAVSRSLGDRSIDGRSDRRPRGDRALSASRLIGTACCGRGRRRRWRMLIRSGGQVSPSGETVAVSVAGAAAAAGVDLN